MGIFSQNLEGSTNKDLWPLSWILRWINGLLVANLPILGWVSPILIIWSVTILAICSSIWWVLCILLHICVGNIWLSCIWNALCENWWWCNGDFYWFNLIYDNSVIVTAYYLYRLNSEKFRNFHFWKKFTKNWTRMNFRIFTNSHYIKFVYRVNS